MLLVYLLHKVYKGRFNELFETFSKEDEAKRQERMKINRRVYLITWIGAIGAIVCTLIMRWSAVGSIL